MTSQQEKEIISKNAHLKQILSYEGKKPLVIRRHFVRDVHRMNKMPYRRRENEEKTVAHDGQRKLLIAEIEFLMLDDSKTVVYAGAAPGDHIPFLAKLFPEKHFHLFDPSPFSLVSHDNITVINDLFDPHVNKFVGKDVLFISDIRSTEWSEVSESEMEQAIVRDMELQESWCLKMEPRLAMLKFRLPWTSGLTKYFDGELKLPVHGPATTTECRLITDCKSYAVYDHKAHEEKMFYFNTVFRVSVFGTVLDCNCYDCYATEYILAQYALKCGVLVKLPKVKLTTKKDDFSKPTPMYKKYHVGIKRYQNRVLASEHFDLVNFCKRIKTRLGMLNMVVTPDAERIYRDKPNIQKGHAWDFEYMDDEFCAVYIKMKSKQRYPEMKNVLHYIGNQLDGSIFVHYGCGPGFEMEAMGSKYDMIGYDNSPSFVHFARTGGLDVECIDVRECSIIEDSVCVFFYVSGIPDFQSLIWKAIDMVELGKVRGVIIVDRFKNNTVSHQLSHMSVTCQRPVNNDKVMIITRFGLGMNLESIPYPDAFSF